MELDELKQAWQEHTDSINRGLNLKLHSFRLAQLERTRSALATFRFYLWVELLAGAVLLLFSGSYIANHFLVPTLSVPALLFASSALVAVVGCIRKLAFLQRIDYSEPVILIQKKLESVKLSFLHTIRWMILMLPLYMVYVVLGLNLLFGWDILAHGSPAFLWANFLFSLILVAPATWLFQKLSLNVTNPVVRLLVRNGGGEQLLAAMTFLTSIHEFETEEKPGIVRAQ